jgi:hypothetical protein
VNLFDQPKQKKLDAIARKHNPRVHRVSDKIVLKVPAFLREKAQALMLTASIAEAKERSESRWQKELARRAEQKKICRVMILNYVRHLSYASRVGRGHLVEITGYSKSVVYDHMLSLIANYEITGYYEGKARRLMVWGRD